MYKDKTALSGCLFRPSYLPLYNRWNGKQIICCRLKSIKNMLHFIYFKYNASFCVSHDNMNLLSYTKKITLYISNHHTISRLKYLPIVRYMLSSWARAWASKIRKKTIFRYIKYSLKFWLHVIGTSWKSHGDSDSQVDWSVLVIATPFLEPVPGSSGTLCAKKKQENLLQWCLHWKRQKCFSYFTNKGWGAVVNL